MQRYRDYIRCAIYAPLAAAFALLAAAALAGCGWGCEGVCTSSLEVHVRTADGRALDGVELIVRHEGEMLAAAAGDCDQRTTSSGCTAWFGCGDSGHFDVAVAANGYRVSESSVSVPDGECGGEMRTVDMVLSPGNTGAEADSTDLAPAEAGPSPDQGAPGPETASSADAAVSVDG